MDLPVSITTKRLPHASKDVKVYYPVVTHLPNPNVQSTINHAIITASEQNTSRAKFLR